MKFRAGIIAFFTLVFLFMAERPSFAQFQKEAFSQTYGADSTAVRDTSRKILNFKEIFGGLAGKRDMRIGTMFGTSLVIPGASQIYNKEYWKLPIFYGGIAAGIGGGVAMHFRNQQTGNPGDRLASTLCFAGAGVFYYASLMDGAINYKSDRKPHPGRATVYSILCPGLGQAYNGEYWKIPIYLGGILTAGHLYFENRTNYIRFRDIYREVSQPGYQGDCPINSTQAKTYRDLYRRYRDFSLVGLIAVYLLQVIDANVFANMQNFEVNDNLSMSVTPSVTMPDNNNFAMQQPAIGASFGLRF